MKTINIKIQLDGDTVHSVEASTDSHVQCTANGSPMIPHIRQSGSTIGNLITTLGDAIRNPGITFRIQYGSTRLCTAQESRLNDIITALNLNDMNVTSSRALLSVTSQWFGVIDNGELTDGTCRSATQDEFYEYIDNSIARYTDYRITSQSKVR